MSNDRAGEQSNTSKFFDEATVATVNAPADSSRVVAYNLTSKRAANHFHGMAYYQHFNAELDATPHPNTKRTPYLQHDWQAELSGSIWKDHTFFYASWYEQLIPTFFDCDCLMYADTSFGDYPHYSPSEPGKKGAFTGWMLLSTRSP